VDVVLGLSMTATTVRVVLVEGERADGVTIENEAFDTVAPEGVPKPSASEQISNAILATRQNAGSIGHHLVVSGVAWEDAAQQAALRDSMIARGLDDVVLISEQSAAGALAQTIGCALGYDTTAVLLIKFDTAMLSIVNSADGSITDGLTHNFDGAKLVDVLPDIVTSLETNDPHPQGLVIVGSCVGVGAVKSRLESLVAVPVIVPEEPDLGLARGAALAAANAVGIEAPTVGLAYSQDPDGDEVKLFAADTVVVPPLDVEIEDDLDSVVARIGRALPVPVGSLVGAICVVGVVTVVMSLAASIGATTGANRGLSAAENATAPSVVVPTPPPVQGPTMVRDHARACCRGACDHVVGPQTAHSSARGTATGVVARHHRADAGRGRDAARSRRATACGSPANIGSCRGAATSRRATACGSPANIGSCRGAASCIAAHRGRPCPSSPAGTPAHPSLGAADAADRAFTDTSRAFATSRYAARTAFDGTPDPSVGSTASTTTAGLVTGPGPATCSRRRGQRP
jgi:hypothetical protein